MSRRRRRAPSPILTCMACMLLSLEPQELRDELAKLGTVCDDDVSHHCLLQMVTEAMGHDAHLQEFLRGWQGWE